MERKEKKGRLTAEARREAILHEAMRLFSEEGFDADTRTLAKQLNMTQPLLYRYFNSKADLINTVLERMLEKQRSVDWIAIITDRNIGLKDRLVNFSVEYSRVVYSRDWIRLYMFSGLAGGAFNRRVISEITEPLLRQIAVEVRKEQGFPQQRRSSISRRELDYLWLFHGGIYYQAIRRHIYGMHVEEETVNDVIEVCVTSLLEGMAGLPIRS